MHDISKPPITTYDEAYAAIWDRSGWDRGFINNPFAGDEAARLGLVRTRLLLDRLRAPDRAYPIVHVAGSKGKGSTCSFVDSILRAAGVRCGRFLSPHLHSIRERFAVDDQAIDEDAFTRIVAEVLPAAATVERAAPDIGTLTAWELCTAIALLWFARSDCDVAVVEVGLGGTLDATNVIDPAVSMIARLDFEHTSILGTTMAGIAGNKAGIIKRGKPAASVDQPAEGMTVIRERAQAVGAPLLVANEDWFVTGTTGAFDVTGPRWSYRDLRSSLRGAHQLENAGLAIAAIELLAASAEIPIPEKERAVRRGLASTFIPGRFEVVPHASGATVVIDGAHSPASMRALATAIRGEYPGQPVVAIVAMLADKDPGVVLPQLAPVVTRWILTSPESPRALPVARLAAGTGSDAPTGRAATVAEALNTALALPEVTDHDGVIIVTGSLVTAAEARAALNLG